MITLRARDTETRLRAETSFRKSWRKNEVTGKRDDGFKIIHAAPLMGVDWGSQSWFFELPTGTSQGIKEAGLAWSIE